MTPHQPRLFLDGQTDVMIRHDVAHSPARVWRALTEPDLIRRWLSPGLTECRMDVRPAGSFLYAFPDFIFSGPVLDADPPHRMVHVEHFNGDTDRGPTVTTTLTSEGDGTRMTVVMHYSDAAARSDAIEQGFTDGIEDVYGRIGDLTFAD